MRKKPTLLLYAFLDWLAASIVWVVFFIARKVYIEHLPFSDIPSFLLDKAFFKGIIFIPLAWLLFYFLWNTYSPLYKKSRLSELGKTWAQTTIGVFVIFIAILLDDVITAYKDYYFLLLLLLVLHGGLTSFFRLTYLTQIKNKLLSGKIKFNTLIVGGNHAATKIYEEIKALKAGISYDFKGFVAINNEQENGLKVYIPKLGKMEDIPKIIQDKAIENVIIATEKSDHDKISAIFQLLEGEKVDIKIIPDMYDILSGSVKVGDVFGAILIEVDQRLMPIWQFVVKRMIDIIVSMLVLLIGFPIFLFVALKVRLSSEGSIFYTQERIGKKGKIFKMYKFRSMYEGAEDNGPKLSQDKDVRITKWGRTMRKYRLDELPQFYNTLIGDMALVGPRPERQFYIEKLVKVAPHYKHLQKVRPGITSWGMIKYGYASNIDEMVERLKYDILYIENMSLALDLKILIYTILILFQGKGK